jgi:HSP20 family molecular chaperone IbpA
MFNSINALFSELDSVFSTVEAHYCSNGTSNAGWVPTVNTFTTMPTYTTEYIYAPWNSNIWVERRPAIQPTLTKIKDILTSGTGNFPPHDILLSKDDGHLEYRFAIAGYGKEDIGISFEDDEMIISLKQKEKEEEEFEVLKKGVKSAEKTLRYPFPTQKFDIEKTKASMKDGILVISIPRKQEFKPVNVSVE